MEVQPPSHTTVSSIPCDYENFEVTSQLLLSNIQLQSACVVQDH